MAQEHENAVVLEADGEFKAWGRTDS